LHLNCLKSTETQTARQTVTQLDKQTETQTARQTVTQLDKQTDTQTHTNCSNLAL